MDGYEVGTLNLNDVLDSYRRGSLSDILDAYMDGTLDEYQAGTFGKWQGGDPFRGKGPGTRPPSDRGNISGTPDAAMQPLLNRGTQVGPRAGGAAPGGVGSAGGGPHGSSPLGSQWGAGTGGNPGGASGQLTSTGAGLLDPSSDYMQRLLDESAEGIGKTGAAQERAAALRAARSGLGAGASPEMLEMQGDIGRSTMSAIGDANAGIRLGGMGLGAQMLGQGMSGDISMRGQDINRDMGLRGFGSGQYMQQQQLSANAAQNQLQANMQAQQMENDAMFREMALSMEYGMPPPSGEPSPYTGGGGGAYGIGGIGGPRIGG